jgi:DNA-binding transcriptional LysR family regulator
MKTGSSNQEAAIAWHPLKKGFHPDLKMPALPLPTRDSPLATDRLDLLRLFVRIAELGKISAAAELLGLSQPSASRLLRRLETLLKTRLVRRFAQGVTLTPIGEEFLIAARRVLEEWERAIETVDSKRKTLSGHIRVAAPIAVGQNLLASIVAQFLVQQPEVTVDWDLRDDEFDFSASGYDLWIRAGRITQDSLVSREIYRVQRAIISLPKKASIQHPRELEFERAVRLTTFVPSIVELKHDDGEVFKLKQLHAFSTDNLYAAHAAVLAGVGYAVLPLWLIQSDLAANRLVHVCQSWRPEPVLLSLAYTPDQQRPARVSALIDYLRDQMIDNDGVGITFLSSHSALEYVEVAEKGGWSRKLPSREIGNLSQTDNP